MRKKYQIILSFGILIILIFGFTSFIILSQQSMKREITRQVLEDNRVIGEQILKWIKKDIMVNDNIQLINSIQNICNDLVLPNGGFICAMKPNGELVAAPDFDPAMGIMNLNIVNFIANETMELLNESDFKTKRAIKGTLIFENGKRTNIVASLPIDMSDIRLNVHQDSEKIAKRVKEYIKPLVWLSIFISLFLTVLSYFLLDKIIGKYQLTIEKQHKELSQKSKNITDSIEYAKRIQMAVLPSRSKLKSYLEDYFIYFKPKNVVSGDFYWIYRRNEKIVVSVVDCTGHGVPGALMSILGSTLLDEIVNTLNIISPCEILNELRRKL